MRKDFKKDTWEDFNRLARDKDIILFGAGSRGACLANELQKYRSAWRVKAFVDNMDTKWGTNVSGFPVISPEQLKQYDMEKTVVLITTEYVGPISEQCDAMGIRYYFSLFWLNAVMRDAYYQPDIDMRQVNRLLDLMQDDASKRTIEQIVEYRKSGFMDYTSLRCYEEDYFIDGIFHPVEDEVFIDGGAYTGDTMERFACWTKGKFKKIYSFEPDKNVVEKLKEKLYLCGDRVQFHEAGLSNASEDAYMLLTDGIYCGRIGEKADASVRIKTCALDEIVHDKVTFIKMDIEGSEQKALEGAKNLIKTYKPKLAICIYHKLNDLWEIPFWIHSLVPEYKLYVRHHGVRCYGTVLYATL